MKKGVQDEFDEAVTRSVARRGSGSIHFNSGLDRGENMWRVASHTYTVRIAFLPPLVVDTPMG